MQIEIESRNIKSVPTTSLAEHRNDNVGTREY